MKAIVAAAVACSMSSWAFGADMPQRKPGLWQIEIESSQAKGRTVPPMKQCIDEKTDKQMQEQNLHSGSGGKADCEKQSMNRTASGWVVDSVCKIQDSTMTTHATMQGDFNASYTIDSQTKFSPPLHDVSESTAKMKVNWLGACPANMKPGDVDVNGRVFNVLEMQQQRAQMPAGGKMSPEQMKQMMEMMKKQQGAGGQ